MKILDKIIYMRLKWSEKKKTKKNKKQKTPHNHKLTT